MILSLDVVVLPRRGPILGDSDSRRAQPENRESVGMREGKRLQQQRARDAEDGRVRANSDRERKHNHQRQPRIFQKHPRAVAQILNQCAHGASSQSKVGTKINPRQSYSSQSRLSTPYDFSTSASTTMPSI